MAFALLHEPNSEGKRAITMKRALAVKFLGYKKHPETIPDAFWREKTDKIASIWLGRGDEAPRPAPDVPVSEGQQSLTHEGIAQGSYQAIPEHDR